MTTVPCEFFRVSSSLASSGTSCCRFGTRSVFLRCASPCDPADTPTEKVSSETIQKIFVSQLAMETWTSEFPPLKKRHAAKVPESIVPGCKICRRVDTCELFYQSAPLLGGPSTGICAKTFCRNTRICTLENRSPTCIFVETVTSSCTFLHCCTDFEWPLLSGNGFPSIVSVQERHQDQHCGLVDQYKPVNFERLSFRRKALRLNLQRQHVDWDVENHLVYAPSRSLGRVALLSLLLLLTRDPVFLLNDVDLTLCGLGHLDFKWKLNYEL